MSCNGPKKYTPEELNNKLKELFIVDNKIRNLNEEKDKILDDILKHTTPAMISW